MTDTVSRFEYIITALKKPILDATDKIMTNTDASQDVQKILDPVGARMSEIHRILMSILNNTPLETSHGIKDILERGNILSDLHANPDLKGHLINSANLLLKEYPYTRDQNHAHTLESTHTSSVYNIVPNNESSV
jgi:hypothetical protein